MNFPSSTFSSSATIEIYRDKKMGVGSLRSPRECGGRLPPDAGYYLDLVIPRSEEPPKKNTSQVKLSTWKVMEYKVVNLHAIIFQIISKFTSKLPTNDPHIGGAWGGGLYAALLVAVYSPPLP